jgi:hypothetical protein
MMEEMDRDGVSVGTVTVSTTVAMLSHKTAEVYVPTSFGISEHEEFPVRSLRIQTWSEEERDILCK